MDEKKRICCSRCCGTGKIPRWSFFGLFMEIFFGFTSMRECPDCDGTGNILLPKPPEKPTSPNAAAAQQVVEHITGRFPKDSRNGS